MAPDGVGVGRTSRVVESEHQEDAWGGEGTRR